MRILLTFVVRAFVAGRARFPLFHVYVFLFSGVLRPLIIYLCAGGPRFLFGLGDELFRSAYFITEAGDDIGDLHLR